MPTVPRPARCRVRVSMPRELYDHAVRIAAAERRTVSNWIAITLEDAIASYLAEHPELGDPPDEGSS